MPFTTESHERITSPTPGRSTLITSAPMSASRQVANGPDSTCSKARILTPSSARMTFELLATLTSFSVQRFERLELFERFERDLFFFLFDLREQIALRRVRLLPNHHAARVIDDYFPFLLNPARPHFDDAPLRLGLGLAFFQNFRFRIERVSGKPWIGKFDLVPAERETVFAYIRHAQAGDDG